MASRSKKELLIIAVKEKNNYWLIPDQFMVIPVKRITAEGGINLQDLQDFARLRAGELFYLYLNAKTYFRLLSFFSHSFRNRKPDMLNKKIGLSSPAGQKTSPGDETVRRHCFANLPSEDKLFFHPHIPQKCFLRYAKNKNKKHNK